MAQLQPVRNAELAEAQSHRVGEGDFNSKEEFKKQIERYKFQSHRVGEDDFNCHILHFVNSLYNENGNLWQYALCRLPLVGGIGICRR